MMKTIMAVLVSAGLLQLQGCGRDEEAEAEGIVLEVAPYAMPCIGVGSGACLQVREPPEDNWQLLYGQIEGFDFQQGYNYTLRVAPLEQEAEAGNRRNYRLLSVEKQVTVN